MKFSVSSSLRSMRKNAGLSQTQLGLLSGVSQNTISAYETGAYGVSLDHALMIARVLDCHVEDIWSIDDDRLDPDTDSPCDICFRPECVGCKLSEYDAYQQHLGSIADYYYG